jgi:uncharacterized protein with HEPN domain
VKNDDVYLGHIRDAISDTEAYTSVGRDAFLGDRMRQDAVIRKLEIIVKPLNGCPTPHESEDQGFPGSR